MSLPGVMERLSQAGVKLAAKAGNIIASPKAAVTPELVDLIRANKPELLAAIAEQRMEQRRQRVLAMLDANPAITYAFTSDSDANPDAVILTLAIRGIGSCEIWIPRPSHDGMRIMELLDKHSATVH